MRLLMLLITKPEVQYTPFMIPHDEPLTANADPLNFDLSDEESGELDLSIDDELQELIDALNAHFLDMTDEQYESSTTVIHLPEWEMENASKVIQSIYPDHHFEFQSSDEIELPSELPESISTPYWDIFDQLVKSNLCIPVAFTGEDCRVNVTGNLIRDLAAVKLLEAEEFVDLVDALDKSTDYMSDLVVAIHKSLPELDIKIQGHFIDLD